MEEHAAAAVWKKSEKKKKVAQHAAPASKIAEDVTARWFRKHLLAGSAGGSKAHQDAIAGGGFTKRCRVVSAGGSKNREDARRRRCRIDEAPRRCHLRWNEEGLISNLYSCSTLSLIS
jgi:hypothetical protein